jgi:hypothetical protein
MMNKLLITTSTAALILALALGLRAGEHGEREYEHEEHRAGHGPAGAATNDPRAQLYRTECGDCHLAFPPTLLPAGSWRAVMAGLEDHFGDNAELDPTTAREITGFLVQQAAGPGSGEYGERSWRATRDRTPPLRITETDYFRGQHHEIPQSMITANQEIKSFSRCESCHGRADQAIFDEDEVRIPGHGRWDD